MKRILIFLLLTVPVLTFAENLLDAATDGDVTFIENYKGDLNQPLENDGSTALMEAAYYGQIKAVNALITAKADVNAKTKDGWTALMVAVYNENTNSLEIQTEEIKRLIAAKADVNAVAEDESTALSLAEDSTIIDILKKAGAKDEDDDDD